MKLSAKIYSVFVPLVGLPIGVYCSYRVVQMVMNSAAPGHELFQLIVLLVLHIVCRCLPIYIREDYAVDMSFICNFATLLCKGPFVASAIVLVCTPFVIEPAPPGVEGKRYLHIFNTEPRKLLFNVSNSIISVFAGGFMFELCGGVVGDLSFPGILLPAIVLIITVILCNSAILLTLFALDGMVSFFPAMLKNVIDFWPSIIAAAPIGYFIANFMGMKDGEYLVILFMLPLLLARYAFILYLDAKKNYYNMIKTLTTTLEAKDEYTEGHSYRVEHYAEMIARQMRMSPQRIEDIKVAALLHDVGKIGIDDLILNKPARLTKEEFDIIKTHPLISVKILENVKLTDEVRNAILHHHERYDGRGYPDGTKEDEVPVEVYILGVADAYDAMTSDRPYSRGKTMSEAIEVLKEESGAQFHPEVVEAFVKAVRMDKDGGRRQEELFSQIELTELL